MIAFPHCTEVGFGPRMELYSREGEGAECFGNAARVCCRVLGNDDPDRVWLWSEHGRDPRRSSVRRLSVGQLWLGVAVILGVYASAGVSGAHLNPAVTVALAVFRDFLVGKVVPFIIAQVAGAVLERHWF